MGDEWSRFACFHATQDGVNHLRNGSRSNGTAARVHSKRAKPSKEVRYWISLTWRMPRWLRGLRNRARAVMRHPRLPVLLKTFLSKGMIPINPALDRVRKAFADDPELRVRKTLRVSAPEGIQRSSYFVSMPWRYGIPLISAMSILHWLASQSVFVYVAELYRADGTLDTNQQLFTGTGFSSEPMICGKWKMPAIGSWC